MITGTKPTDVSKLSDACLALEIDQKKFTGQSKPIIKYFQGEIAVPEELIKAFPMPESRLLAWIEALESGKYSQGHGTLSELGGFCCLGVEAEIWGKFKKTINEETGDTRYNGSLFLHPHLLAGWLNISSDGGVLSLVLLNDGFHFSFYDIAQVIKHFVSGTKD